MCWPVISTPNRLQGHPEHHRRHALAAPDKDNPRKHGPYHQLSYTRNNRRTSEFVRAVDLQAVLQQIADYDHFIAMKDEWIDASIELTKLRRAARRTGGKP